MSIILLIFVLKLIINQNQYLKIMKTAENLLRLLGVQNYTQRHIQIINDFIKIDDENVKKLLDQLGGWDSDDLKQAELWMQL